MDFTNILEQKASTAPACEAFSKCSLHAIKDTVKQLLELFGREGIFSEYTRHDISHIDKLLELLAWLVPQSTLERMTTADFLLVTLAVYFHDLGLVVSREEFAKRSESGFPAFKDQVFAGNKGADYHDKLRKMAPDEAERFLYQEFVRQHHPERIRGWLSGKVPNQFGHSQAIVKEIQQVLSGLPAKFLRDLGVVCESHHEEDLDNLEKYKPSQPYGSHPQEIANVQYSAVLLRTADLLHVTKDRTPSVSFRMINPSDPKSVEEWQKQMAVISVRPKPGVDKDGNVDLSAPREIIQVDGYFTEPEGFFALSGYLSYAREQLRHSNDWVQKARKKKGALHEFPWRDIDESGLEAQGFIDKQFEFSLDQGKILDLLTGHTLYNDSTVVLRELVQNSLDAIRIQWEGESAFIKDAEVRITWDSASRNLSIEDNGTGMTQRTIDEHFLKVGSSLYQDAEFRKHHPNFSPISRFGIGVLSTFMISDEIQVTTCHPDDEQARALSLRSLHGKYLIRLLDKDSSAVPPFIFPHGTKVNLRVRPSAELRDLVRVLKRWILFPKCKVTALVNGDAPTSIGYLEPKDALLDALSEHGLLKDAEPTDADRQEPSLKVEQRSKDGVTLAYALRWSPYFNEWTFMSGDERQQAEGLRIGTCVEGILVDRFSPGYRGFPLVAIANATGPTAPKTNVARSGLEQTAELRNLLALLYELYCDHVKDEVEALQHSRAFSLTWSLGEAEWLLRPLFRAIYNPDRAGDALSTDLLLEACSSVKSVPIEEKGTRVGVSPAELSKYPVFWTVDSALFSSAETLVKEVASPATISNLAEAIGGTILRLPPDPFISTLGRRVSPQDLVFRRREVDRIIVVQAQRRVDLRWTNVGSQPYWRHSSPENEQIRRILTQFLSDSARSTRIQADPGAIYIGQRKVQIEGAGEELAIRSLGVTFILHGTIYAQYLIDLLNAIDRSPDATKLATYAIALQPLLSGTRVPNAKEYIERESIRLARDTPYGRVQRIVDPELEGMLLETDFTVFSPLAWVRG